MARVLLLPRMVLVFLLIATAVQSTVSTGTDAAAARTPMQAVAALTQIAATQGSVRVIVSLKAPALAAAGTTSAQVVAAAQPALRVTRAALLQSLQGTAASVNAGLDWVFPAVAMTVDSAALARLSASPLVSSIEPDRIVTLADQPADMLIGAPTAWTTYGATGQGQAVAIVDTGVQEDHPFFGGRVVAEACFSSTSPCPNGQPSQLGPGAGAPCTGSECEHGTHVAGIAAGNGFYSGGIGQGGVAIDASIIAVRVFSDAGTAMVSDVISGLNYVYSLRNSYHIAAVNLSLSDNRDSATACDAQEPAFAAAIGTLLGAGIATVAAAGNSGYTDGISAPACISTAISVGAVNDSDYVAAFSNSGPNLTFLAPGVAINSSLPGSTYGYRSGTSMAAPMVTGALAVLRSRFPTLTVAQLVARLKKTGTPVLDQRNQLTQPRIQLDAALANLPLSPATLPAGTVDGSYSMPLSLTGGLKPISYAAAPASPPGLTLDPDSGLLSGAPTAAGTFPFTITALDSQSYIGSQAYTFTVQQAATSLSLAAGTTTLDLGQSLPLTATLSPNSPAAPSGTVVFTATSDLGTSTVLTGMVSNGQASVAFPGQPGAHRYSVTASYSGDANFLPSSAGLNGSVSQLGCMVQGIVTQNRVGMFSIQHLSAPISGNAHVLGVLDGMLAVSQPSLTACSTTGTVHTATISGTAGGGNRLFPAGAALTLHVQTQAGGAASVLVRSGGQSAVLVGAPTSSPAHLTISSF